MAGMVLAVGVGARQEVLAWAPTLTLCLVVVVVVVVVVVAYDM